MKQEESLSEKGHEIKSRHDKNNPDKSHYNYYQADVKEAVRELEEIDNKRDITWEDIKRIFGAKLT